MSQSYNDITPETARHLKLLMADIDGTLNEGGDTVIPEVTETVLKLEAKGILVGLVSGRTGPMLQKMAALLDINGPLIAENGAIARLSPTSAALELGYSRQPATAALAKLYTAYPGQITERWDNSERLIDIVFQAEGVPLEELQKQLPDVQVLDSRYIMHLMQKGISKGQTLLKILPMIAGSNIKADEVMVAGDSATDLSLFEIFPQSVLVRNPRIPPDESLMLQKTARYISDSEQGYGFAEVVAHILDLLNLQPR
jgi:hydroxymethylpyrimidine pyrophosphatase-like HAD family hydrolase